MQNLATNLTQNVVRNERQPITVGATTQTTGKAADSGYTQQRKQASQQANRQIVQNWWNNEQAKSAQDNSTDRAYTAKLTGGASIDNSTEMMKSLQRTFGGANDSAKTQYNRTLQSKQGYGRNWGNPRSAVGNAIESGVADTAAGWLNAAGTALKSDRRSGLAVDSGKVDAKTTGNEWYNRAGNYLQKEADWAQMLSENAYLRGSRNLNNAQKLLFDGAVAGTQMAADLALGALTGGSATIPMAIRSFGSGAQLARQEGASENQQILYGVANAAVEAATEKMFDGVARIHGKGMADDMVDDFAKRWAKSEGGQALVRGLVNAGGEGLEEIASGLAAPALQSIYNGKTLGENYRDLNMADLLHEGAVGILLGNLGGAVNIAQTGRGNTQNYQQGNSRAFGGQMRNTTHADSLRNADLNSLYTAAESNTQRSKPYAAAYTTSVQQQRSTPHTANNETAGESQTLSYAKVFRQLQAEQEKTADLEYARYKELERRFVDGSINEREWNELLKLENVWGQFDTPDKRAGSDLKPRTGIQKGETEAWQKSLQNKENIATLMSKINSREISTRIRSQVQGKHIEGTKQFDEYLDIRRVRGQMPQSILTISEQEAQELVDKYRGTGDVVIQKSGENSLKICEFCEADRIVGKWYGENRFHETKRFEIFYSKKGTHVVPVKEIYND